MPKLPIAVAVINSYDGGKKKTAGLLLGSFENKEGFLESLDTEAPNTKPLMGGVGINKFTAADGSTHRLMDPGLDQMRTVSAAYVKDVKYILIFDQEAVDKIQRLDYKILAVNYNDQSNDVTLRPATPESLAQPPKTVSDEQAKELFNKMLPRINDAAERLSAHDEKTLSPPSSPAHQGFFSTIPTNPPEQDNRIVEDWNRTDPNYTPLSIDGVIIQDLVKQQRHLDKVPVPLFPDMKSLEEFFKVNLLKNVKPYEQEKAMQVLKNTLHQGAWQRPMSAAAFDAVTKASDGGIGPMDARANIHADKERGIEEDVKQKRVTNINTTPEGFSITDEVIQRECVYTQGDQAGDPIYPDEGQDFVYHAKVKINLDFSQKLDDREPWPKVEFSDQSIKFGNKEVEKILTKDEPANKSFFTKVYDFLVKIIDTITFRNSSPPPSPHM
jgi:hypothetical protein